MEALVEVKILEHLRERDLESTSNALHSTSSSSVSSHSQAVEEYLQYLSGRAHAGLFLLQAGSDSEILKLSSWAWTVEGITCA